MSTDDISNSVGLTEAQTATIALRQGGLKLGNGKSLSELTVTYETYGKLSPDRNNVIYVCHALTGDAHVAGKHSPSDKKPGWWDDMVGPGKGIDTNYYFVICGNILGGCAGTTGPSSINPATGKPYGSAFPEITVADMVDVHKLLLEHLDINHLAAVIGGSLGGMQVLEWSIRYPDMVDRCICIAAGASVSAQALAFDAVARDAIIADPHWAGGDYYDKKEKPAWGLAHARKIGHITYLSPEIMQQRFGREARKDEDTDKHRFQIAAYLDHQGQKLVSRFDANSYLLIAGAMDSYDLVREFGSLARAFENVGSRFLIIGLSSDWLFPPEQSVDIANALHLAGKRVSCCTLEAPYGHDAFLVNIEHLAETVRAFLPWVGTVRGQQTSDRGPEEERRFKIIAESIKHETRVLDLGCGNGELLSLLLAEKKTLGLGVDIDIDNLIQVIDRGHDVFQGDLDEGLALIPDGAYDYAVLSSTLQVVRKPRAVLHEMLRVAKEGIITFPNFGHWRNRLALAFSGRMPKSDALPHEWYDTPNIHLATLTNFVELCRQEDIEICDMVCSPGNHSLDKLLVALGFCNLGAERVLARITRLNPDKQHPLHCRCID